MKDSTRVKQERHDHLFNLLVFAQMNCNPIEYASRQQELLVEIANNLLNHLEEEIKLETEEESSDL